ncbi:hypothetical protein K505DRAFT_244992 [Melanomma pulvis-pyrius CBS 109.77]|uniref:Uncharacterized protein n=1 Tax=Melanomma pulvis-pyrius CBS 109.77 TaxID=1314802 RepID=A0A6A6XBV5_9PLEO|nr:hypothetical protein K505DRAFT_244992 [Melanomma pulvis-pyrius CBS 109.77]
MSTIGRLTAALAAATNDVTVAAANINFDFTLVKCEAPREFHTLGSMLATTRKLNAEAGTTHVTAQRLGALFEGCCPPTPKLLKAYGRRVSDISAAAKDTNSLDYSESIFSAYTGIDGTSIWAAATSSKAALHVHLLACMIARVFDAAEAVSIWVELTKERRSNIATSFESGAQLPFSLATAAVQNPITKAHLAEWDASARSWLRTADEIKKAEHSQFQSLLKYISLEVSQHESVFPSVMGAWTSALTTMENLVSGQPQAVHDGSILLALSAWHLYPNMAVFGSHSFEFALDDSLVNPAGVITIGVSPSRRTSNAGVFWCLSLAHLRHYGKPVRTERSLQQDPTRLTFPQFILAALGTFTSGWQLPSKDRVSGMNFMMAICNAFEKGPDAKAKAASLISRIVSAHISSHGDDLVNGNKLIQLGRRRSQAFTGELEAVDPPVPYFNLLESGHLFKCIKTLEMLISFLRHIVSSLLANGDYANGDFIIRYNLNAGADLFPQKYWNDMRKNVFKKKRAMSIDEFSQATENDDQIETEPEPGTDDDDEGYPQQFGYTTVAPGWCSTFSRLPRSEFMSLSKHHRWLPLGIPFKNIPPNEHCHRCLVTPFTATGESSFRITDDTDARDEFEYYCGDANSAAVYCRTSVRANIPDFRLTEEDLLWCKEAGYLSDAKLVSAMSLVTVGIFNALAVVASVYEHLPDATIAVQALEKPILRSKWYSETIKGMTILPQTKRAVALAIVAYFDLGSCDLSPSDMDNVMAVSSGDSIYVPRQLLCDPIESPRPSHLTRLLGNFGQPGVVLLRPTQEPMMKDLDYRKIMSIATLEFDGKKVDSFGRTSLHLSFTDRHVPIYDTNARLGKDSQVSVIESFISVRDSGTWVADIDILHALNRNDVIRLHSQVPCIHTDHNRLYPGSGGWSVDSWDEILDCPSDRFVVRAHGNWLARLAVTSVLSQVLQAKGKGKITVCQPDTCWRCLWKDNASGPDEPLRHGYIY